MQKYIIKFNFTSKGFKSDIIPSIKIKGHISKYSTISTINHLHISEENFLLIEASKVEHSVISSRNIGSFFPLF